MEKTLKQLFDFQKFEGNADLASVIDSVHARYTRRKLSLEETELVNAAGTPHYFPQKKDQEKDRP